MVNLDSIIYISEIKEHDNLFGEMDYRFEVLWAGREVVNFIYKNKESCVLDWENLKTNLKIHTESLICD